MRLLAERNMQYSADFLIAASFATEGSQKMEGAPNAVEKSGGMVDQAEIGKGAFVARDDLLGNPAEVGELIEEFKRALAANGKGQEVNQDLVDLWIRAEPWLDEREIAELWPGFVAQLPGEPEQIRRSRGLDPQGGGS
jgi:hypothetical protein